MVDIAVRSARTELDRDVWVHKRDLRPEQPEGREYILANAKRPGDQLAQTASSGSAIAISQDGLVLTNHDVVDNCKTIEVTNGNGRSPASSVKASDRLRYFATHITAEQGSRLPWSGARFLAF